MLKYDVIFLFDQGGVWVPGDGVVNPTDVAMALSKKAREMGKYTQTAK